MSSVASVLYRRVACRSRATTVYTLAGGRVHGRVNRVTKGGRHTADQTTPLSTQTPGYVRAESQTSRDTQTAIRAPQVAARQRTI